MKPEQTVGCIGLGHLGHTIARRLIDQGVPVAVWNRTPKKASDLGVPVAASPRDLVGRVDVVLINLFDSDAVESVLSGPEGLLSGPCTGKIIIDTTTNHFGRVSDFYAGARDHGATYLECPVLGSVVPASQGKLTVLVSGDEGTYEVVKPLLSRIGSTLYYLGEPALATKMKLINNLVLGSFMATCAEAVALGEAAGIDRGEVIDILLSGAGNSMVLAAKKDKLKNREFSPHFSSALIYKDLHYLQDLCRTLKKPLFVGSTVKEVFALARSKGIDEQDFSVLYEVFREF
ncbi:6-phosphogluconate dehydrogenase, NAD-binding [Methanoregula boonei 6A8]|uniref:6-phosphogluconate dehydrogenase, NAD-binding n=1 Tax=Methanoregula boonei (strain DSM 21154 / JCM 14090 / 6A8) TaxID=456442 RepID=A7I8V1_METB6|nr:NAD(P)-dependent oxidoreductase [Methanoregula boonei]ABS56162.1 6-phosphogluconate dehydrogenase, NAD-binding [Methanoregula boonei 6A8]